MLLRWPPILFLGQLSLEIYLLHDPIVKIAIFTLELNSSALLPQVIFNMIPLSLCFILQEDVAAIFGCGFITIVLSYIFYRVLPLIGSKIHKTIRECNFHHGNSAIEMDELP